MRSKLLLILCLVFSLVIFCSTIALAEYIIEGLWLGPVNAKVSATQSVNIDYLEDGEDEVSIWENGPAEGDVYTVQKEELTWEVRRGSGNQFNIDGLWGDKSNHTAYFYIYIECTKDIDDVDLWLGSDDTLKVWVNGEVVHTHPGERGITIDGDRKTISLEKGWNALMAKIGETGGGWAFSINFPSLPREVKDITTEKPEPGAVEPGEKLATTWGSIKE